MKLLLSNAWGWLLGHVRLAIEYVLIAVVVALGAWALWARTHSAQQDAQIQDLAHSLRDSQQTIVALGQANLMQDRAIDGLKRIREKDALAILGLQTDVTRVDALRASAKAKLDQLEKNNARAKELLDIAVPDDIGCVLDGRPCASASPARSDPG